MAPSIVFIGQKGEGEGCLMRPRDVVVCTTQRTRWRGRSSSEARACFKIPENEASDLLPASPSSADEIDAIGTKRYDAHSGGEKEIQRTMLELLNQLDGFDSLTDVKVRHACASGGRLVL